ncbi:MAG: lysophospholipid acyltransferase family protein [Burkholderiales bacterium]
MLKGFLRLLAGLPLFWLHAAGAALGWLVYLSSPKYAHRLRENLLQSRVWTDEAHFQRLLHANVSESGKGIAEVPAIWFRPQAEVASWVRTAHGLELVEAAHQAGKGLMVLTPHLGCFEVIAQYCALHSPFTVLYRPPRIEALRPVIIEGRTRPNLASGSADLKGVRILLKALRRGEAVGILPDQVPAAGDGEWADFFGRPAYTMTLVAKLHEATGATMLMCYAKRLPRGQGYEIVFQSMPDAAEGESRARRLNRALESVIRQCPEQYLWSYNRYKQPRSRATPGMTADHAGRGPA